MFAPALAPLALEARLTQARGWGAPSAPRTLRNVRYLLIGDKLERGKFCLNSVLIVVGRLIYQFSHVIVVQHVVPGVHCVFCFPIFQVSVFRGVSWSWGGPYSLYHSTLFSQDIHLLVATAPQHTRHQYS